MPQLLPTSHSWLLLTRSCCSRPQAVDGGLYLIGYMRDEGKAPSKYNPQAECAPLPASANRFYCFDTMPSVANRVGV